jgi:hypothetical protein
MAHAKLISNDVVMNTPWPMLGYVHDLTIENRKLRVELEAVQAKLNHVKPRRKLTPQPRRKLTPQNWF